MPKCQECLLNNHHLDFLIKYQGGTAQVRFQPNIGQLLAAAAESVVSVFDVESDRNLHTLQVPYIIFN